MKSYTEHGIWTRLMDASFYRKDHQMVFVNREIKQVLVALRQRGSKSREEWDAAFNAFPRQSREQMAPHYEAWVRFKRIK